MSLIDAIASHAARTPDRCALHFEGQDISYRALWQRVEDATLDLRRQGVKSGERVAWLGLNDPYLIVLLLALCRIGAILLPLNYRLAPTELQDILDHAQARLMLTDSAHRSMALVLAVAEASAVRPSPAASAASAEAASSIAPVSPIAPAEPALTAPAVGDDLPALLVYTSGTTGKPKGALHTQAGLMANCVASQHAHGFTANDHVLSALPLFHVGGLCIQTLPALVAGARVTLLARFDAGDWLRHVATVKPTMSLLVPAAMQAVITHPAFASTDLSSLRLLNAGSSTIPLSLIGAFHARSIPVCQVYGATETGPVSIYLQRSEALQHAGSAGRAGLGVEVRLVNDAGLDVNEGEVGEVGEIWLRAPNLMHGYWRDPGNPSFQNGWFHSGDLARRDLEGFYWIVGRSKDMIISGGENIYPAEIENILADCPHIADAAVLGMPDERWGEMAVAVVVRRAGSAIDEAGVMQLFEGKLARFKQPRQVLFVDALPKSALGKVIKSQLKSTIIKNREE